MGHERKNRRTAESASEEPKLHQELQSFSAYTNNVSINKNNRIKMLIVCCSKQYQRNRNIRKRERIYTSEKCTTNNQLYSYSHTLYSVVS